MRKKKGRQNTCKRYLRMTGNITIVKALEKLWPKNKAKGLLAQTVFLQQVDDKIFGVDGGEKIVSGCWLFAPKSSDFYKFRFCFFVHPQVFKIDNPLKDTKEVFGEKYRPFHAIAEFMNNAGIGVIYVVPRTKTGKLDLEEIKNDDFTGIEWIFLNFQNGQFTHKDPADFFGRWPGDRGRASHGGNWDPETKSKIKLLKGEILTDLLLNELFYAGFLKGILRKPVNDPYDVDSFLISISQKHIFPMEIKEKFPAESGRDKFFGIDAGRIMMLLRMCLPNDANAIYLIREVDENNNFVGWKYITLSDIIMTSSWNLQAGGPGMGGQSTQTIRLPYDYFREFNTNEISEDNLQRIGNMPKDIKTIARQFCLELSARFY